MITSKAILPQQGVRYNLYLHDDAFIAMCYITKPITSTRARILIGFFKTQ